MGRAVDVFFRVEGPTWLVLIATFSIWAGLVFFHEDLPWYVLATLGGLVTAMHASLIHESVHCLRCVPRWLRESLFFLPVGIWYPYYMYVRSHTAHHREAYLTDPDRDPESFYYQPEDWQKLAPMMKKTMTANQTFAGRMILGPVIVIIRLFVHEYRCFMIGKKNSFIFSNSNT